MTETCTDGISIQKISHLTFQENQYTVYELFFKKA